MNCLSSWPIQGRRNHFWMDKTSICVLPESNLKKKLESAFFFRFNGEAFHVTNKFRPEITVHLVLQSILKKSNFKKILVPGDIVQLLSYQKVNKVLLLQHFFVQIFWPLSNPWFESHYSLRNVPLSKSEQSRLKKLCIGLVSTISCMY